jgi:GGDEF domain-containing protein
MRLAPRYPYDTNPGDKIKKDLEFFDQFRSTLTWLAGGAAAWLTLVVGIFGAIGPDNFKALFIDLRVKYNPWPLLSIEFILLVGVTHYIISLMRRYYESKEQLEESRREISRLVGESKRDIMTGIPNLNKFGDDIQRINVDSAAHKRYQIMIIDLIGFRDINRRVGQVNANHIVKYIAQSIYTKMRRDEEAYRRPMPKMSPCDYVSGVYRTYGGGDEFIFLLEGSQSDALGFLNRLDERFKKEFNGRVKRLFHNDIHLSFWGGVASLQPDSTIESALANVDELLETAKNKGCRYRVLWEQFEGIRRVPAEEMKDVDIIAENKGGKDDFNYVNALERFRK